MGEFYGRVLARVHDEGYTAFARAAARDIAHHLKAHPTLAPTIIDAGCGSGALAAAIPALVPGATVWGVDVSGHMLDIARSAAAHATFVQCDILDVALWPCSVVCAVGEVFNYALSDHDDEDALWAFFGRAYDALSPGGLLLFDVAHPGRHEGQEVSDQQGALTVTMTPRLDATRQQLTRDIIVAGPDDIGIHETHHLRLLQHAAVKAKLIDAGFGVQVKDHYSHVALRAHWSVYVATKPLA